ncbi:MAG: FMN-binding glutamate synthase family protein, partial [Gammaproteobacteria bacterium]|nr:FMN-binding glutamate synthase family protein [Gammaproteobacteria bacterium]
VAQYAHWVNHEVNMLAHSCGLSHASEFRREHIRLVQSPGQSLTLAELYPYRDVKHVVFESKS